MIDFFIFRIISLYQLHELLQVFFLAHINIKVQFLCIKFYNKVHIMFLHYVILGVRIESLVIICSNNT
jgi:hypothetical protein